LFAGQCAPGGETTDAQLEVKIDENLSKVEKQCLYSHGADLSNNQACLDV
jgi:hypothetical protein